MQRLAEGVLTQIASLLNVECAGILVLREEGDRSREVLRARRLRLLQRLVGSARAGDPRAGIAQARRRGLRAPACTTFHASARCSTSAPAAGARWWSSSRPAASLSETDRALVEVFCSRLSVAFDNVILYEQLQQANAAPRGARRRAHPRADRRQRAPCRAVASSCAGQRASRARSSAPSRTTSRTRSASSSAGPRCCPSCLPQSRSRRTRRGADRPYPRVRRSA